MSLTLTLTLGATTALASAPAVPTRPTHTHHVSAQTAAPAKPATPTKPSAKSTKPAPAKKNDAKPADAKPHSTPKFKKRRQTEPDFDPTPIYRASSTRGRPSRELEHSFPVRAAKPEHREIVAAKPEPREMQTAKLEPAVPEPPHAYGTNREKRLHGDTEATAPHEPRKLTAEDFMIAAGKSDASAAPEPEAASSEPPPTEPAPATHAPTAKPQPAHAKPAPAQEAVIRPAPIVRETPPTQRPEPQRIDGFGAEGAILTPKTPAERRTSTVPTPKPHAAPESAEDARDDAVLASLAKPTHQELAEEAAQPKVIGLYSHNGRIIVPPPLRGSHDVLVHQNTMADAEGLDRIQDDDDLDRLRAHHQLVDFPESASLHLNPELPENRRCARLWSVKFATDMARAYYARFHQPLQVNSAARSVAYQLRLERTNGNAAAVDGEGASPHLTGQAIDIGKRGMSAAQLAWMRYYLMPLMQAGKVDVEEEFQQACFHISVYKSYLPAPRRTPKTEVAKLEKQ